MAMTREQYLQFRQNDDQAEILAAYFNHKSGENVEVGNFTYLMFAAIEDDPILQQKIDYQYNLIVEYFDKLYNINFIVKEYDENNRVLLGMY